MEKLLMFPDGYCNSSVLPEELKCMSEIDRIELINFTLPLANQCTLNAPQTYSPCNLIPKHELPNYCSKMENIFQSPKKCPSYSPLKESIKRRQKLDEYLEEREKLLEKKRRKGDYNLQKEKFERISLISPKHDILKASKRGISEFTIHKKCLLAGVRTNRKDSDKIHLIKTPMSKLSCLNIKEEPKQGSM